MKVKCINDLNKPKNIPDNQWIKKGEEYTVVRIVRLALQENTLGLILKEISLDNSCFPYEFYDANRFIIESTSDKELLEETDLNKI